MKSRPNSFRGLRHLALKVPNLEECVEFYTQIIGMELLYKASDNLIYLTLGNDNLSLSRGRADSDPFGGQMDHFGFIVETKDDLQAWHEFMKAEGVNVLDNPHDHSDGARSFHCTDPAGNVVQPIYHPAISSQTFN